MIAKNHASTITELNLQCGYSDIVNRELFANALIQLNQLKILKLHLFYWIYSQTQFGIEYLSNSEYLPRSLTYLDLSHSEWDDLTSTSESRCANLMHLCKFQNLRFLDIDAKVLSLEKWIEIYTSFDYLELLPDRSLAFLVQALQQKPCFLSLKSLSVCAFYTYEGYDWTCLGQLQALTTFNFHLKRPEFLQHFQALNHLTTLNICDSHVQPSAFENGSFDKFTQLKIFECDETALNDNALQRLAKVARFLNKFSISRADDPELPDNPFEMSPPFSLKQLQQFSQLEHLEFVRLEWLNKVNISQFIAHYPPRLFNLTIYLPSSIDSAYEIVEEIAKAPPILSSFSFDGFPPNFDVNEFNSIKRLLHIPSLYSINIGPQMMHENEWSVLEAQLQDYLINIVRRPLHLAGCKIVFQI
jgi:hypothetical protein